MIQLLFFLFLSYILLRLFIWSFGELTDALYKYNKDEMSKKALKRNSKKSKKIKIKFARGAGKR